MRKIALLFISIIFASCATFLNEKTDAEDKLPKYFSQVKAGEVSVVYIPVTDDFVLTANSSEEAITLTASNDFSAYSWTLDGESIAETEHEISIAFSSLEGGWHLVTVIACDTNGNYHSAAVYFQVMGEKVPYGASVTTYFEGNDATTLSLSYATEDDTVTLTATSGFASYIWLLDDTVFTGDGNTATIDLSALNAGIHIVTVIAKNESGIYYSACAEITKNETIEPDIQCSGITAIFASESADAFAVTSIAGATWGALSATSGFASYSWTIDGNAVAESSNTLNVNLASLKAGWHIVTVSASTSSGLYYSAAIQVQKTEVAGSASVQSGAITFGFTETSEELSLSAISSSTAVSLTATSGFDSYAWTLDGTSLSGSDNTVSVSLASLETGWHVVFVTAIKDGIYYSSSTYIQKEGA